MKKFLVIAMLIIMATTQTTITPKAQACVCSNLLNQIDCQALTGCQWTPSNSTNSLNSTNSTNTATSLTGTCANATTNTTTLVVAIPTFCGSITNGTTCAGQIGCAYLNNTCQIFTGCSAYLKTTHSDCQLISTQCTTDGTQCALPVACNIYTTQTVCVGSQGSTTRNCKWTPTAGSATTGTCSDTTCADAPTSLATLAQCQAYIPTCFSTGKGCVAALASCTTYLTMDGCSTRIGLEGKCIDTTPASANCRAQVCTDATQATASSCATFLSSSSCLFNGKGCVAGPLPACNTYLVSQSCDSMIGSDGKCTTDKNSTTNCKLYTCADAPTSTVTDSDCQKIASTCVTNGQGCLTSPLPQCQTYTGTTSTPCTSFKGINGICKASATAQCTERTCMDDAAKAFTTDAQCESYFKGCVTKGLGCVATRSPCENYTGTADECGKFIGTGGNCTLGTDGRCQTKQCSAADTSFTTNAQCQNYSFSCYTNGQGCTTLATCEAAQQLTTCSGNISCSSVNNLCLGVSDCANFSTQTQCNLNNQSYKPTGSTITYSRKCQWAIAVCGNITCSEIATKLSVTLSDLKDDATCKAKQDGCLFGGASAGGCVDVNDDCTKYTGTLTTCQNYKGSQGKDQCINTSANASTATTCVKKACSSAKTQSTTTISQQNHCQVFQSTGCYFNGVDNCTDGGCASYFFGDNCNTVSTAKDNSGKTLSCVKDATQSNNQCKNKTCADAAPSVANLFNTDTLCNAWLTGCVTDGTKCVDPTSTQCSAYKGTQDQCTKFSYKPTPTTLQQCTKVAKFCLAFTSCSAHFIPSTLTSSNDKSIECQLFVESTDFQNCMFDSSASKCANPTTCDKYVTTFTGAQAQSYCNKLKIKSKSCWWSTGNSCAIVEDCTSFTILNGPEDKDAAAQCQKLSPDGTTFCGYIATATKCSARSCSDFGIGATSVQDCINYLATCEGYSTLGFCYTKKTNCADYTINATVYDTQIKKAIYCSSIESNDSKCSYDQKTYKCVVGGCEYVTFSESSGPDESEKQAVCLNSRTYGGSKCVYNRLYSITECSNPEYCNQYNMSGNLSNAERQAYCQNMVNSNGDTCNYALGFPICMDYENIPRIVQCNQFYTYQSTDADNLKFCSNLTPRKNGPKCSYSLSRPERCSDFACSYQSSTTCANYPSLCIYSGISCISLQAACGGYTIETSATDKTAYCLQLTGTTGSKKCAYNGATSTTNCSDRACADLSSSDSQKTCTDYLSTCTYDGTKCVSSLDCTTITPTGTINSDKVTFCNKLGNGKIALL